CRNRSRDAWRAPLDLPSPLFVHKEEGIVPNVPAEVTARYVQAEFRTRFACLVQEVVVSRKGFVSVEFPNRTMVALRSGLDHHRDLPAGADAVVRTVVAVECLEFRESIDRR